MMGLYFIAVIVLWLCLSVWVMVRLARWRVASHDEHKTKRQVVSALVLLAWFGASFWYSGGRNFYYDWKVRQLCAVDGGVKVYETAPLKPEMLDWAGRIHIPDKKNIQPTDEYYYDSEFFYYHKDNPQVERSLTRIVRRSDGKTLGEYIRYGRGGGDLLGPWHGSSFLCPSPTDGGVRFESAIFTKGDKN